MSTKALNRTVAVITYVVAVAVSLFLLLDAAWAKTPSYASSYADETRRLTSCPPGSVWVQDNANTSTCRDNKGTAHGLKVVRCPGIYDKGLQRRSFFWLNRGLLHGQYKFRDCAADADSDEFEREGYYVNNKRHGMTVWRDIKGTVHTSCTYVSDKLEGVCIEHTGSSPSFSSAGFVVKRYYKNHCQYKEEILDAAGRMFRSCEISGCKDEFNCVNSFAGPAKTPVLRRLTSLEISSAVVACYAQQPVAHLPTSVGAFFTGPFVEVSSVGEIKREGRLAYTVVNVRVRNFGAVDAGNSTELTWEDYKLLRFEFTTDRAGFWTPTKCPWR